MHHQVAFPAVPEQFFERTAVEVGAVANGYLLPAAGYAPVVLLHQRSEPAGKFCPLSIYYRAVPCQHEVEAFEQSAVGRGVLERPVALHQYPVVILHCGQVSGVHLRNYGVGKAPALLAGLADEGGVGGGDHYDGQNPDVFRDSLVQAFVAAYLLARGSDSYAEARLQSVVHTVEPAYRKTGTTLPEIVSVTLGKGALGH